ncbi:MAG: 8-oxoguanine deaminase [Phycisphaerae bacterium]|nr:8-oxoguanine deaminase [Phycisphaerae bacterium]
MRTRIDDAVLVALRAGVPTSLEHHGILIAGERIEAVGPTDAVKQFPADRVIDGSEHLVVPGFINTHHHLYQSLTRGLPAVQSCGLFDWLAHLYERWSSLDYASVKLAAQVCIAELLLSGCTTTSDHFYLFPAGSDVRLEAVLDAADSLGMRIHACRGSMSVGRSRGGLPPDRCVQDEAAILADCQRVLDRFHDATIGAMRRIDLAPCSPFSVSPELLKETAMLARSRGVLLHTHAAETLDEQAYCLERFGVRPIEYLRQHHWLGPDVYLAHCVHVSDGEIDLLARTLTSVAHCPSSNMRLGSGVPPVRRMLERGVNVSIGVDGSSSNDGGDLVGEARQALLLQRVAGGPAAMTPAQAFEIATRGGARALNRQELGDLAVGMAADIAMFRADDIALAGAIAHDPLGALMLCRAPRADRVFVNGRIVVEDGRLAGVDAGRLAAEFNDLVRRRFRA